MAIPSVSKSPAAVSDPAATNTGAMAMVTTLFFMWGFLTCLNDILIPHLKTIFDLSYAEVMMVQFVFFSGYVIFAIPASKVVEWIGYQGTMVAGLLTMAVGALLFVPAANVPSFPFFLSALIVLAAGITALQVSANPYVSVLGPAKTASSRLNLTQAFNSLGTTIAPYFGSLLILSAVVRSPAEIQSMPAPALQAYRLQEAASVKLPYILIAVALVVLAVAIAIFKLPAIQSASDEAANSPGETTGSLWKQRHLILGVVGIFVYVGAEVAIGSFLVNYLSLPEIGGMSRKTAAAYVSFYWGFAMLGRFIGAAVLQKLRAGRVLAFVAVSAFILVVISMLSFGSVAMWTILLVGLFNSVMFPSIFTLGIAELGPLMSRGSGLLVAAIVGGAIIPEFEGLLADHIGIHRAFILPALCYIYIAYYGLRGSRVLTPSRA